MVKKLLQSFFHNKRAIELGPRQIVYWILILSFCLAIVFLIKGIANKLLNVYS